MSVDISDGLAAYIATQGSARAALTGGLLLIFGGEIAESANAAQSASLLWTVSVDGTGTGLSFEASPVGRALVKAEAETWSGPTSAGVATHWRLVGPGGFRQERLRRPVRFPLESRPGVVGARRVRPGVSTL